MNALTKLFSSGATDLVKSIGGVIDNLSTSKEEKETLKLEFEKAANIHLEKLGEQANREFELQIQDANSARNRDIEANNSLNASWLSKNINPILASAVTILTFGLFYYSFRATIKPESKDIVVYVLGAMSATLTQVYSYYFGASKQRHTK